MITLNDTPRIVLVLALACAVQAASTRADETARKQNELTQSQHFGQALAESLAFAHQAEIEISRLASERATSEAVRELADKMVRTHTDSLDRVMRFAPAATDIRQYSADTVSTKTRSDEKRSNSDKSRTNADKPPMKIVKDPSGEDGTSTDRRETQSGPERVLIDYEDRLEAGTLRDDFGGGTGDAAQPIEGADYQELVADNRREMENKRGIGPGVSPAEYAERVADAVDARVPALSDTEARRDRIDRMTEPKIDPIAEDIAEESDGVINESADRVNRKRNARRSKQDRTTDQTRRSGKSRRATNATGQANAFAAGMSRVWTAAASKQLEMTTERLESLGGYDFDWSYLHQQHFAHTEMLANLTAMKSFGNARFQNLVDRSIDQVEEHIESIEDTMKVLEAVASAS